ncbi:uncharacterized protein LOC118410544 [Branchiostoma floridae]|uniref:Uncharacterized protein LOC118410544 n=1 Tax=Branchiostoma floridae TaxID=7739 RepID=A0A9J7KQB9_BRAFL|nr:uncharacterized protein LOC118410544 [Branchiostoma floridae]
MAFCVLVFTPFFLLETFATTAPPLSTMKPENVTINITVVPTAEITTFTAENTTIENNGTDCDHDWCLFGTKWALPVLIAAGVILVGIVVFFVVFCVRRSKRFRQRDQENGTASCKRRKIEQELSEMLTKRNTQPPAPLPRRGRVVSDAAAKIAECATESAEPTTPQYIQLEDPMDSYLVPGQPVHDPDQDYDYADTEPCAGATQGNDGYLQPGVRVHDATEDYENSDVCKHPTEDYENSQVWTSGASAQDNDLPEYANTPGPARQDSELYEDVLVPERKSAGSKGKGTRASLRNAWNKYVNVGFRRQKSDYQDDDIYEDTCVPKR